MVKSKPTQDTAELSTTSSSNTVLAEPRKKRSRLIWSKQLHQRFLQVMQRLGMSAKPKMVLKLMNVPGLTRSSVASHLQKYRQERRHMAAQQGPFCQTDWVWIDNADDQIYQPLPTLRDDFVDQAARSRTGDPLPNPAQGEPSEGGAAGTLYTKSDASAPGPAHNVGANAPEVISAPLQVVGEPFVPPMHAPMHAPMRGVDPSNQITSSSYSSLIPMRPYDQAMPQGMGTISGTGQPRAYRATAPHTTHAPAWGANTLYYPPQNNQQFRN